MVVDVLPTALRWIKRPCMAAAVPNASARPAARREEPRSLRHVKAGSPSAS
jgi:hypothetical protein